MPKGAGAIILVVVVLLSAVVIDVSRACAQQIRYAFTDPVADQTGPVDVTSFVLIFRQLGSYSIYLTADPAHPFFGKFRVNINLYNPDVDPQFATFSHACSKKCAGFGGNTDYDMIVPQTKLVITGHNDVLKHWPAGTRAITSSFAGLGNPPGTSLFRSSIDGLPFTYLTNEDCIACDGTGVAVGELTFARRGWVLPTPLPTP